MSRVVDDRRAVTIQHFFKAKKEGRRFSCVTCYDGAFARILDKTDIDLVLVGDSMGNVVLGFENTLPVTVDHVVHHTAAVARTLRRPFLVADMPFMSYATVELALTNAARMVREGGAKAVKLEGGRNVLPQVRALVDAGIPVMGHIGLQPQSVNVTGGYKVIGRGEEGRRKLLEEAKALEEAGVFSLVLEMVPSPVAQDVTAALSVPTIGIGAGPHTDGQILVLHDLLGFDEEFKPKFLKKYANLGRLIEEAVGAYVRDVKEGAYPDQAHSFDE